MNRRIAIGTMTEMMQRMRETHVQNSSQMPATDRKPAGFGFDHDLEAPNILKKAVRQDIKGARSGNIQNAKHLVSNHCIRGPRRLQSLI